MYTQNTGCFGDFLSLGSRYGAQAVRAAVEGKAASRRKAKKIDGAAVAAAQGVALLDCTSPQALAKLLTSLPTAEAALLLTEVARRSSGDGEGPVGAVLSLLPSGSTASMLAAATPAARARMLGAFSSLPQRQAAFRRLSLEAQADAVAAMPSPNQRSAAMAMAEDRAELEVAVEKTLKKVEGGNRMKNSRPTGSAGTEGDRDQAELTKLMGKGKALTPAETQRVQTLMQKQGKKSAGKSKSDGALDAPVVVPQHPPAAPPVAKAENPAMEASTTVAPHDEASVHALASLLASCGLTHFLKAFVGAGHGSITAVASLSEAELIAAGLKRGHILKLRRAVTADPDEGEPTQAASHAAAGVPEFKEEEAWDTPAEAAPAMFLGCIPCVWFS